MTQPREIVYVRLSDVRPAATNPRVHDLPTIEAGIEDLGYLDAVVEDARTGRLIAGHGRIEALVQLRAQGKPVPDGILVDDDGEWMLPVQRGWASRDDAAAAAALVGHNKSTENARWNDYGLAALLEQVATDAPALLDATGADEEFLNELLRSVNPERLGEQDPERPEPLPPADPEPGRDAIADDGSIAETEDEHKAKDTVDIICPECGHRLVTRI